MESLPDLLVISRTQSQHKLACCSSTSKVLLTINKRRKRAGVIPVAHSKLMMVCLKLQRLYLSKTFFCGWNSIKCQICYWIWYWKKSFDWLIQDFLLYKSPNHESNKLKNPINQRATSKIQQYMWQLTKAWLQTYQNFFLLKEIIIFIRQGHIKSVKCDSKDMYDVYFK